LEVVLRERGRITLPASIRRALGLRAGDELEVSIERGGIILRPKRRVSFEDLKGVLGPMEVELEEVEEAVGRVEIR